ncbi:MAG: chorismate mutase [Tissierellia bacterium]|nr:chorismate mutase [Tissierellia bacterium]
MNLEDLRKEIDGIDQEMVQLFLRRMEIVKGVAQYKIDNQLPVFHKDREQVVIDKAMSRSPEEMKEYVREFFEETMKVSRHMQEDLIKESKK